MKISLFYPTGQIELVLFHQVHIEKEYNEIEKRYGTSDYDINEEYKKSYAWSDEYHGAEFVKDENRYASFVWKCRGS